MSSQLIDYNKVKELVSIDGENLNNLSDYYKNHKEIVRIAVSNKPYALRYASDTLKNDKKIVSIAIKKNGYFLQFASKNLKNDKKIVMLAVSNYGNALEFASCNLQNNTLVGDKSSNEQRCRALSITIQ